MKAGITGRFITLDNNKIALDFDPGIDCDTIFIEDREKFKNICPFPRVDANRLDEKWFSPRKSSPRR